MPDLRVGMVIRWQNRTVKLMEFISETPRRYWFLVKVLGVKPPVLDYIHIPKDVETGVEILEEKENDETY